MPESTTYKTVSLELRKPWYINYLQYVFGYDEDLGIIKINRDEVLGRYILSMIRFSYKPVKLKSEAEYIKLVIPNRNDTARFSFTYFTNDDITRISDAIEALAYIDSRSIIHSAHIDLGMSKKNIMYIYSTMIYGEEKYEAMKKDEQRKRQKQIKWLKKSAKELGYSII